MRILFPYLARWDSANRTRYHHLLSALARRNHQIIVLQPPPLPGALDTNYQEIARPPTPGIEVRDVHVPRQLWQRQFPSDKVVRRGLAAWYTRPVIRNIVKDRQTDVVLLYNIAQMGLRPPQGTLLVIDVADDAVAMLVHEMSLFGPLIALPARALVRRWLGGADLVTTPSTVLAERIGDRARLVPNGADLTLASQADGAQIRKRFTPPIVGYVGAFEYFMDFELVLETARQLPECTFLLVGGGRDWPAVQRGVHQRDLRNVHIFGAVGYREALDYVAALDIALIPFRAGAVADSSSPLKLFEYLAFRKPVISTSALETRRIAGDWVSFANSPEEFGQMIREIHRSPSMALEKTRKGTTEVATRYRWDQIAATFESVVKGTTFFREEYGAYSP